MMLIELKRLQAQNFLSIKSPITFEFQNGIDVVIARNGTGKSALFLDALHFVFYNSAYRDISLKQLINRDIRKNALVEVIFNIGDEQYKVKRGIEPKVFEITKDGNVELSSSANDLQDILEDKILKTNRKLFKSIVALNSDFAKNWLNMSSNDKAEVLKWITDSEVFKGMRTLAVSKLKALRGELENNLFQCDLLHNQKSQFEEKQQEISLSDKLIMEELEAEIRLLENEIFSKEDNANLYIKAQRDINDKNVKIEQLKNTIIFKKSHIDKIEQITCPKCNEMFYVEDVDEKKQDLKNDIREYKRLIAERTQINDQALLLEKDYQDYTKSIKQIEMKRYEQSSLQSKSTNIVSFSEKIDEIEENIKLLTSKQLSIQKGIDLYSEIINILKSNNVQDYLSNQLSTFNKICNLIFSDFYLEDDISIEVDGGFNVNIKKTNQTINFQSLSSGERSRVGFSLLLGFVNFLEQKNSVCWNVLVFDEVLDVSFDYNGREALIELLKLISHKKNIILISHNAEIEEMSAEFNRKIHLIKKNGTQMEENNENF